MLTSNDLAQIENIVDRVVDKKLEDKLEKKLLPINQGIRKLQKSLKLVTNYFDSVEIKHTAAIKRLENHLGLSSML